MHSCFSWLTQPQKHPQLAKFAWFWVKLWYFQKIIFFNSILYIFNQNYFEKLLFSLNCHNLSQNHPILQFGGGPEPSRSLLEASLNFFLKIDSSWAVYFMKNKSAISIDANCMFRLIMHKPWDCVSTDNIVRSFYGEPNYQQKCEYNQVKACIQEWKKCLQLIIQ